VWRISSVVCVAAGDGAPACLLEAASTVTNDGEMKKLGPPQLARLTRELGPPTQGGQLPAAVPDSFERTEPFGTRCSDSRPDQFGFEHLLTNS
jgi:hypothetical protein